MDNKIEYLVDDTPLDLTTLENLSDEEFEKMLKEICPDWIPIEERSSEAQEKADERIFNNMDYIKLALQIATKAHKGQKDKAGVDYINHPIFVSSLCVNAEEKIVALLHDVVEDTEITLENLKAYGFSDEIITAVDCITKRHNEPIENYLHRVKTNELARVVKLADLKHNMDLSRLKNPTEKDYLRLNKYKSEYNFLYKN